MRRQKLFNFFSNSFLIVYQDRLTIPGEKISQPSSLVFSKSLRHYFHVKSKKSNSGHTQREIGWEEQVLSTLKKRIKGSRPWDDMTDEEQEDNRLLLES